ncbi:unnamed protein product, partial [Prorocentrum cordatum]
MVGYDLEDKAYCMELTFNYGLNSYKAGTGLREFGLFVPDVEAAVATAKGLGYAVQGGAITGPDGYTFRPLPLPAGRGEKFLYTSSAGSGTSRRPPSSTGTSSACRTRRCPPCPACPPRRPRSATPPPRTRTVGSWCCSSSTRTGPHR